MGVLIFKILTISFVYYRQLKESLMALNSRRAFGIDSEGYLTWSWLTTRHWLYILVYCRYLKVALMALDSAKAFGIDLTRYNKGHWLCTRYWLYILVYCRYLKVARMVLDQQRHLASTWLGITKGIDYIHGTHCIIWFIVGISRWYSLWFWISKGTWHRLD